MKFRRRHIVARLARVWGTFRAGPALDPGITDPGMAGPALPGPCDSQLFDQFESLGDGCEFAAVQRYAAIERLGLFKWAGVDLPVLIRLLDADLADVEDPTRFHMRAEARPGGRFEYMIDHHVFGSSMHAADSVNDLDPVEAKTRETRRLALMKRKFLDDVRAARRIYIYASLKPRPIEQVDALFDALGRFGPNRLLFIREADADLPAGAMRLRRPGLAEAAIDALALYETGTLIRSSMWPELMRDAHALLAPDEAQVAC